MKIICLSIFLFFSTLVSAQDFIYPYIIQEAKTAREFAPRDWSITDSTKGDLNKDGLDDYALILKSDSGKYYIFVILLSATSDNSLTLAARTNSLITDSNDRNIFYEEMEINANVLSIVFMKAGKLEISTYKFRLKNKEFYLIGVDRRGGNDQDGKYTDYSFNFLTKKWSTTTGIDDESDVKPVVKWGQLRSVEIKTLKTFKAPYTWMVEGINL